ncbi:baseplate J/gp47 family protein [Acidocella aminolytica]|uniref:Baseplate protein J-like barrel domain-containing protein n=1 Tax=Acidocella aminolytica 101 = DSM 11237 TaxID=1120923 RepID=A0A0D6PDJ9_9PROT|nr:baseplate J/gp47 family protein [Acidocella aminolytica]GAN79835.1 hypothetical protein Aam_030_068 [Acidocella aminolytica 101 = DSM 11237]GBQ31987.1 hypothetical protein AA11237_0034 [Acidocella aminolytica 101 = DSM 11237]SHF35988.1 Uncharacterized phage protein gp47/JayE [Acidocella aminolytica 101 = DSM 11237]
MTLSLQNFTSLVQGAAAAVQGACSTLLDLTVGSVLRAILEANAALGLWMQWLIVQVLAVSRLNTSTGSDVDSFIEQFGMSRLPAIASSGQLTFSRFTATGSAFVAVGDQARTAGGAYFTVTADTSNPVYSAALAGYVVAAGTASITVPAVAAAAGAAGNVQAGAVNLLGNSISGIDTVTNAAAFTGGLDAESDTACIARFPLFLASLAGATVNAIKAAIAGVQQGLDYAISENVNTQGTAQLGNFVVTVDDGSGNPSAALLAEVSGAVNAERPVATSYSVQGPTVTSAAVTFSFDAPSTIKSSLIGPVQTSVTNFINRLTIGQTLSLSRVSNIAYNASEYISNVTNVLINGVASDLTPSAMGVVRASSVVAS